LPSVRTADESGPEVKVLNRDLFTTTAQVIPTLLIALVIERGFSFRGRYMSRPERAVGVVFALVIFGGELAALDQLTSHPLLHPDTAQMWSLGGVSILLGLMLYFVLLPGKGNGGGGSDASD